VAHRGASSEAPENTLEAFAKAIELGADMIEFDVRRAPNGTLVISHDPVRMPSPHLPTLEDTLLATKGRIQLDVELKEEGCEGDALALLLRHFAIGDFSITSFLPSALRETRAIDARVRTGLIFAFWTKETRAAAAGGAADFLVAQDRLAAKAERIGKPLFVWTVDDPARIRELFERPLVEAIVTNNPRQALALRAAQSR
jgi:glycerophosphoryl diester phosphodiesterase